MPAAVYKDHHRSKCISTLDHSYRVLGMRTRSQSQRTQRSYSHLSSSSLMVSGGTLSLSTKSLTTLPHFCSESMASQGRDRSTTNTTSESSRFSVDTANFCRPLWYRSPSSTHALHRAWSAKKSFVSFSMPVFNVLMLVIRVPLYSQVTENVLDN